MSTNMTRVETVLVYRCYRCGYQAVIDSEADAPSECPWCEQMKQGTTWIGGKSLPQRFEGEDPHRNGGG